MGKSKITNALLYSLATISVIGFLGIMVNVWLDYSWILENSTAYMLIILGAGLVIEGQIRRWSKFPKGGFSSSEVTHVVTGVIGLLAVFVGLLDLLGATGANLLATQGIISAIAVIIIVLQTWVVD